MNLFVLNPSVLIYPRKIDGVRNFVLDYSAGEPPIIIHSPRIVEALTEKDTFTKDFFLNKLESLETKKVLTKLFELLQERNVILEKENCKKSERWSKHNWYEAFQYQESTKNYPFVQMNSPSAFEIDEERMIKYKQSSTIPSIYQELPYVKRYKLNTVDNIEDLNEYIANQTPSSFDDKLSFLCNLCFGERRKQKFGVQGNFLKKVIPSGGSRHPTEVFFIIFSAKKFEPGIYHYNVKRNSLDLIKKGDFYKKTEDATFDLLERYEKKSSAVIIFTSLYERSMWRYRDSRSWRAVPIDLGHYMMVFRQVSGKLGLSSYSYQKFKDGAIAKLLGLDIVRQSPLYVASIVE